LPSLGWPRNAFRPAGLNPPSAGAETRSWANVGPANHKWGCTMGNRRWRGHVRTVAWCAWRDCAVALPAAQLFCPQHGREALALLAEHGVLRPREELVPATPKRTPK